MTQEERYQLEIISSYMGHPLTEEQMEFASDFRQSTISFSDPGTGKTHTLIAGLIMAQKAYNIPGDKINCMSFTKAAVYEIKKRYDRVHKRCGLRNGEAVINTFHRLSRIILNDAYPRMKPKGQIKLKDALADISRYMTEVGLDGADDYNYVKKVYSAINSLNSALIFHPDAMERNYDFVQINMEVEDFQELRKKWFLRSITAGEVVQGDIPLYCLYALLSDPDLIAKWHGRYDIMVVDEFQDLSLLHLQILSLISKTLIVIGDMKQQIYHFNGACPQIVEEYLKLHPEARVCNLTESFRCCQEIAKFATDIIRPNDPSVKEFKGIRTGGYVGIEQRRNMDWESLAHAIKKDIDDNSYAKSRDIMFLYRNNESAIPIVEELYQLQVPFRCTKYQTVMETPIFKELCILANVAWQPGNIEYAIEAFKLFPEFKDTPWGEDPAPVTVMRMTGKNVFDINFKYRDESSYAFLQAMKIAQKKIQEHKSAGVVFMNLLDVYDKYIIKGQYWKLDNEKDYYFNLIAPICNSKEYGLLINEEYDKKAKNEQCIRANAGIRLYTMHSAKGLEADDVYILDCDEGKFPNRKVLKRKLEAGCAYDAACDIRSERNLLYVALTRAKENVVVTYSGDKPCELLIHPFDNEYLELDAVYAEENQDFNNLEWFCRVFYLGEFAEV